MRLMCSQNQAEVEAVRKELFEAGIAAEVRPDLTAQAMGVTAHELWVPNARNFFNASRLYARMKDPAATKSEGPATTAEQHSSHPQDVNGADSTRTSEAGSEDLKHASSLPEKSIADMFRRESQLAAECASLCAKLEESGQALAQGKAALALEMQGRLAAEKNQAQQTSALMSTLERERQKWQQQIKSSDDSLKSAQEKLSSMSRQVQSLQAAEAALRKQIASLELLRDQHEATLSDARTIALEEREGRIAAEARAKKACSAQAALEKQLLEQKELEQQMLAHFARLNSLFGTKAAPRS